jgi:hypothetical protein
VSRAGAVPDRFDLEDPNRVLKILHWSGTVAAHYTPHYYDCFV